ncbi:MAG: formate C-acetyltransferase/glycerol dehydratase family glycyl radical enzyme [Clostridiales Family XIII bacterium]|jgi:formate C-acetyltransferase|nr:formate C-acetyltransferase/glycerol dehydratase family glycyl radical enzyme [Clostridiales Family XIII bacterium]
MESNTDILKAPQNPPLAIEPYDKEWGVGVSGLTEEPSPFPRVNKLLRWLKETDSTCDSQRALIVTECFEKYAAYPQNVKWAMTLREVLTRYEINIWPDELLVGELVAPPNGAPVYPEFSIDWLINEFDQRPMENRKNDRYVISKKIQQDIRTLAPKWKNKTVSEASIADYTWKERQGSHLGKGVLLESLFLYAGVGHVCADYSKLLKVGFGGLRKEIEDLADSLDTSKPEDVKKQEFYGAELIMLDGVKIWIERYGKLAWEQAKTETDKTRRKELTRISENCMQIAEGVPQDFWQAVQLWQFATTLIIIEANGHSVTYGRFDEIFADFYEHGIRTGTLTREFMQEIIELSFLKIHQLRKIRDTMAITFSSGTIMGGTALDVGGVDADGKDITNDLSYMVLDAHAHTRIPNPWMGVRLHEGSPKEFKTKVFNVIRIGTGEPKIFNDGPMIASLTAYGATIEDARNYVGIGCVEPSVPGKTYGWHDSGSVNLAKILQLSINKGRCIDCAESCEFYGNCAGAGGSLGPDTGSLETFKSFDEVIVSFDKQMEYWTDMLVSCIHKIDYAQQRIKPLPYLSLLVEGPIEKGVDITLGSATYNHSGPQAVGIGTAADSLSVIKQIVFDEGRASGAELLEALRADWEGHEPLYALVNGDRMHHFGNDDDYADDLAKFVMATYCKHIEFKPTAHGGDFKPGVFSVTNNVLHGSLVSATPDGRKAGEPVSDCIGPVHTQAGSHDRRGPTAVAKSVSKLDHSRIANGIILNWKFSPTAVSGETGRENLIALMDTYFEDEGMQSQFSVVGRETMLAAQKQPDKYRDLVVRIAGYSAYFTELSAELQNDLIGRTELSFD